MITLHGFGPMFELADPSPFVMKIMALLEIAGGDARKLLNALESAATLAEAAGVGEHDGTDRTAGQLVPHELESLLSGGAEQVQDDLGGERDAAEVHRDGGGLLRRGVG